jgi:hypothetical protein
MARKLGFTSTSVLFLFMLIVSGLSPLGPEKAFSADDPTYFDTCPAYPTGVSDTTVPGEVYYWRESDSSNLNGLTDTIYLAGDLPILITVPHGGSIYTYDPAKTEQVLPDRSCGTTTRDAYTMKLAYELMNAIRNRLGGYPHMILNRLPRTKIDQNRTATEDCNPSAKPRGVKAWNDFHVNFKKKAIDAIIQNFGKGLYIDIHGKPDNYGSAVHVGYHLTSSDLTNNSDATLNNESKRFINDSTIRFLYKNLKLGANPPLFTRLLREDLSFGTILDGYISAIDDPYYVFHAAPRTDVRKPYPYYSGEYNVLHFCGATQNADGIDYNTAAYGNAYTATNFISGFQLETAYRIRQYHSEEYADKVALSIRDFLDLNFGF